MEKESMELKSPESFLKTGDSISTRRGYDGIFVTKLFNGNAVVMLNGCTYSDSHWYDEIPFKDIIKCKYCGGVLTVGHVCTEESLCLAS